jgi:hypothetical protein
MHVVPEPENILAALICALEQPHTITERGGNLFIEAAIASGTPDAASFYACRSNAHQYRPTNASQPGVWHVLACLACVKEPTRSKLLSLRQA